MKSGSPLPFILPIPFIVAGFVIGGRDGAIIAIVGSAWLMIYSFWMVIKIVGK